MPTAEIITIGTELLLGEIQDTNTRYLARTLRDYGIDLYRTMTIGDNIQRISTSIKEALSRSDIIITTGGLGPTVDDPTRQAIAQALSVDLEYHPELWDQILSRFQRYNHIPGENNKRQAFIPHGAIPVENPVGTAPAFIFEKYNQSIISLPGVPHEMEYLIQNSILPYLRDHFHLQGIIKANVIHTASIGESQVDELVGDLEANSNPTVGLLAHPGQVDIRITAKASTVEEADRMILEVRNIIQSRLGKYIFGEDDVHLENIIMSALSSKNWGISLLESGTGGELFRRLSIDHGNRINAEIETTALDDPTLSESMDHLFSRFHSDLTLGLSLIPSDLKLDLTMILKLHDTQQVLKRSYGGPAQNGPEWAANTALDFLRSSISKN